jgi:hypothetical protein
MSVHANGSIQRLSSIFICQKCPENSPLLRGQGNAGSLYVRLSPHSGTFVLFNDAFFFTHGNKITMIYHHDDIIPDQGTVMFL